MLLVPLKSWAYNTEDTRTVSEPKVGGHEQMTD